MTVTYKGRNVSIRIGDAASPEVFTQVGGIRNATVNVNNEPVDVTNVESLGVREWDPAAGIQEIAISGDGVVSNDTQFKAMITQSVNRTLINYQIHFENGDMFEGAFVIESLTRTGNFNDAETWNVSMRSSDVFTYTPGS